MKSLAGEIRFLAMMQIEADIMSNVKNTWDAIKETDPAKRVELFVERAGKTLKRWMDMKMPGIEKAISQGTGGMLALTPMGELMSRDRSIRIKL